MSRGKHSTAAARRRLNASNEVITNLDTDNKRLRRDLREQTRIAERVPSLEERIRILTMDLELCTTSELRELQTTIATERKNQETEREHFAKIIRHLLDQLPKHDPDLIGPPNEGLSARDWAWLRATLGHTFGDFLGGSRAERRDFDSCDPESMKHVLVQNNRAKTNAIYTAAHFGNPEAQRWIEMLNESRVKDGS